METELELAGSQATNQAVGMNGEVMAETILACGDTVGKLRRALRSAGCSAAKYLADAKELFHDDALLTQIPIAGTSCASITKERGEDPKQEDIIPSSLRGGESCE